MRLVYSDEAGIGDVKIEPIVVVAAIAIHGDDQSGPIEKEIQGIMDDLVPKKSHDTFEFRASRLFSHLSKGNNEQILRRFLAIIPNHLLPISTGAANRVLMKENAAKYSLPWHEHYPQNMAFLLCAMGIEELFRQQFPEERALWIADETRAKLRLQASLRTYQRESILSKSSRSRFDHIIDTIYFGDSKQSRFIQLADVCNFFVKRHAMKDRSAERFYDLIKSRILGGETAILEGKQGRKE
jgi:uncharacterized protein DUF3800